MHLNSYERDVFFMMYAFQVVILVMNNLNIKRYNLSQNVLNANRTRHSGCANNVKMYFAVDAL